LDFNNIANNLSKLSFFLENIEFTLKGDK